MIKHVTKIKWTDNLHWRNETRARAYRYCIESENVPEFLQVTEQKQTNKKTRMLLNI